jgi:cobalamin synthase
MTRELRHDLQAAIACLTGFHLRWSVPDRGRLARAMLFFPAVGAAVGGALAVCVVAARDVVPGPVLSIACVLVLAALSRAEGLRALAALAGRTDHAPPPGSVGPGTRLAMLAILACKTAVLAATAESLLGYALFLGATLGRWAPVVLAYGARPVRAQPGDSLAVGRVGFREFGWASVLAIGLALVAADALGLVVAVVASAVSTAMRLWTYRTRGEMTAGMLVAAIEIVESAVFAVLALLSALSANPAVRAPL